MTESISEKPGSDIREGTSVTHWGVVETIVVDGKISKIEPIPEDRRPSPNLKALAELPYAPSRIRYPMVRESYLKEIWLFFASESVSCGLGSLFCITGKCVLLYKNPPGDAHFALR